MVHKYQGIKYYNNPLKSSGALSLVTPVDPFFNNVVLYLKGDGTNNSIDIVDSSPTPKIITRFGDTKISTVQSKYGGSSLLFDGNNDYLSQTTGSLWNLNNTTFTIEGWIRNLVLPVPGSFTNIQTLLATQTFNGVNGWAVSINNNSKFTWSNNGAVGFITTNGFTVNNWVHFAVVNTGTIGNFFINGVKEANMSTSHSNTSSQLKIGALVYGSGFDYWYNGYIDSIRITLGMARYTTNFNPETDTYLAY